MIKLKENPMEIFYIFLLLSLVIMISHKKEFTEPTQFNPFENAAETKFKIWYDPDTKKELAAHIIVTKSYKKFLWFKKVVDEGWDYNMTFSNPIKLDSGKLITETAQLPYYIK